MNHGREKAVRFGTGSSLVGIVTEPAAGTQSADKPAFVMLNSGILHRVGSCRLHVRLARALSAQGFTCLRFDYSGIGDSDQRRDTLAFAAGARQETREAMDYLARVRGVQRFILVGLCSGADMAHETAVEDDRVSGLVLIDGWAYRTAWHYVQHALDHYGPRVLKWRVWQNSIRIRWQMMRGTFVNPRATVLNAGEEMEAPQYLRVFPPRERVEKELQAFVDRDVSMYFLWTGGLPEYNHRGQYRAAFRGVNFGDLLREDFLSDADHILTGLPHQEYVLSNVVAWARDSADVRPQRHDDGALAMASGAAASGARG